MRARTAIVVTAVFFAACPAAACQRWGRAARADCGARASRNEGWRSQRSLGREPTWSGGEWGFGHTSGGGDGFIPGYANGG